MIEEQLYNFFREDLDKEYLSNYKETFTKYLFSENFKILLTTTMKDRNFSVFSLLKLLTDYSNNYNSILTNKKRFLDPSKLSRTFQIQ